MNRRQVTVALTLTPCLLGVGAAQGLNITLPTTLNVRLQALPSFGAAPTFRTLDAAASSRFLNGNTLWLTAQSLQANQVARVQALNANLAKLQVRANEPAVQAVLRAVQARGVQEPLLTVQGRSGPQTVKLLSAEVGARQLAESLGENTEANALAFLNRTAADLNLPTRLAQQLTQAPAAQRLSVARQVRPDLARFTTARLNGIGLAPEGEGQGLDATVAGCAPLPGGLFSRADFPMKRNLPAVKGQGGRGTCWSFASVGLVETLIADRFGRRANLSEQDYVANYKLRYETPTAPDGAWAEDSLQKAAQVGYRFAFENAWQYNVSLARSATETPKDSGKFVYAGSCTNYPFQAQCEDSVSQAETGCILTDGKTVCGAQLPTQRSPYSVDTTFLKNFYDVKNPEPGMGVALVALALGTPVLMTHDARYLINSNGFVSDLPYSAVNHVEKTASGTKVVPNTDKDVEAWNHVAMLVGYVDNAEVGQLIPGAPAAAGGGYFIMKNSWGSCVGDGGYYYLPWNWVKKYAGRLSAGTRVLRN